ncbi:MAG: 3,4-dihydroxy-2-butanone-4-phosphate synthase [Lentisphaeria bacterium]|nr:3,4-dihydroxy-2-butanone-4-phosphate synthase [Lentisphaeria bacterium]
MGFDPIEEVIAAYGRGEIVIITDDEDRENEGDLIAAATLSDAATVNFMVTHGRGLFCVPLAPEIAARIGLAQPEGKHDPRCTCFTQSVDAVAGTTTGVSAFDRAETVRRLMDETATLEEFYTPGHVFPLIARAGGVLERPGHTEASVDLARLAGLPPGGVLCEILNPDGTMARVPQLLEFKQRFNLKMGSVEALRAHLAAGK